MSGAIEKAKNPEGYEAIVRQTMEKENCDYDEAVARYNQYLFDPDGYSIMKRNEQLRAKGYNNMEEYIIAEKGQAAWDEIQKNAEEEKQKKQYTSFIVVGALFGVFLAVKPYVLQM